MIAILGATGYMGRSLARSLVTDRRSICLFAREPSKLANEPWPSHVSCHTLSDFRASHFELIINAIGAGDPARVAAIGADILDVTYTWDHLILTSMNYNARYVYLSSGIVYGTFEFPMNADGVLTLPMNHLETVSPYLISKLYAEACHRFAPDRPILDVRVFGYADAGIDIHGSFFLAQLARSVVKGTPFVTLRSEMVRDYAGARELHELIDCWERAAAPNCAVDLYTRGPVSKSILLQHAIARYGIEVHYSEALDTSPTGAKPIYSSRNSGAAALGYGPTRDALQVVLDVLDNIRPAD